MEASETTTLTKEEKLMEIHRRDGSTSMVLGIVGDCLVWYPILGIVGLFLSVFALIKSNRNRTFARDNDIAEHGCNIAGRWCGIGGIIVGSVMLILYIVVFAILALVAFGVLKNSGILSGITSAIGLSIGE